MPAPSPVSLSTRKTQNRPRSVLLTLSAIGLLLSSAVASAEDYVYQAITDFPDIVSGEVPYYVDTIGERNVLAIDAAVHDYREKFARATTTFAGESGTYDVTITALGEIDGEGVFRFLVNGVVIADAQNELVTQDWGEQPHVFEGIDIVTGDVISVESDARSNGLIPENGEFAFARGRWRTLELVAVTPAPTPTPTPPPVANPVTADLSVAVSSLAETVTDGDVFSLDVSASNLSTEMATNPVLLIATTLNLEFISGEACVASASEGLVTCQLAEISNAESMLTALEFRAIQDGQAQISVELSADQEDPDSANNSATTVFEINASASTLPDANGNGVVNVEEPPTNTANTNNQSEPGDATVDAVDGAQETTAAANTNTGSGSGGGSGSVSWPLVCALLLLLFPVGRYRFMAQRVR